MRQLSPLIQDLSENQLLVVLEEALGARVIEKLPQGVGRYQFTHALIQEILTAELSLTRRVRLHTGIARALEELYGRDAEAHAAGHDDYVLWRCTPGPPSSSCLLTDRGPRYGRPPGYRSSIMTCMSVSPMKLELWLGSPGVRLFRTSMPSMSCPKTEWLPSR